MSENNESAQSKIKEKLDSTREFYAETYKDGVHAAGWFETWDAGHKWCESQKPHWWKITSRAHIEAEVQRQDAILKSMGSPKIQRWATGPQR